MTGGTHGSGGTWAPVSQAQTMSLEVSKLSPLAQPKSASFCFERSM